MDSFWRIEGDINAARSTDELHEICKWDNRDKEEWQNYLKRKSD